MWRLDETQQTLVTDHFYVAKSMARKPGMARDPDECLSDSCFGLCNAAYHWSPSITPTFEKYARMCCRNAIFDGWRRRHRNMRGALTNSSCLEQPVLNDPSASLTQGDNDGSLASAILGLPERDQEIMRLRFNGLSNAQVARVLGLSRTVISITAQRAIRRLKAEVAG